MRPPTSLSPLFPARVSRWPACVLMLVGCLAGGVAGAANTNTNASTASDPSVLPSPPPVPTFPQAAEAANLWPRLFYTPAQRAAVVRARQATGEAAAPASVDSQAEPTPPPLTSFVLQGITLASHGASAWINGQMWRNGEVLAGRTIHIQQQAVRLSQKGQPDVVLKPGQTSQEPGQPPLDVVPANTFYKK